MGATSRCDWSDLLPELLILVLRRLEVVDYLRAGAVCRSWCSTVTQRPCLPKRQTPWLMLSDTERHPDTRRFFSLPDRKTYEIHLPEIHGRRCIGSSEGWLITIDELSELQALNPVTRASFALPSLTTFSEVGGAVRDSDGRITDYLLLDNLAPENAPREVPHDLEHMSNYYYQKAILHPSSSGGGYTVAVMYGHANQLASAHVGDESWTELPEPILALDGELPEVWVMYMDILFHQGKLHALSPCGDLIVFDLGGPSSTATLAGSHYHEKRWYDLMYLVESPDGKHLFHVGRNSEWFPVDGDDERESVLPGDARRTIEFAVFKLDESQKKWLEVKDLGDAAFFIGHNHSVALSTREFPELRSSCIYFTDNCHKGYVLERGAIRDVGVFDLKDASYEWANSTDWNWPPEIWVTPTLFELSAA